MAPHTPVLLPGKSHGRSSLGGYSPWGRKESDTTEQLHFQFSSFELCIPSDLTPKFVSFPIKNTV